MFSRRRKHTREIIAKDCMVESSSEKWHVRGRVINISEGGVGLDLGRVPKPNEEIILHMTDKGGREMARKGVVMWFIHKTPPEEGATVGVKFVS